MVDDEVVPRRKPGRPRRTDEEQARVRETIIEATEEVFAAHGYRDVTVTRIIEVAGITRPNFYRYYRNAQEPLRIMLERFMGTMIDEITVAVTTAGGGSAPVEAGIDAYLAWCRSYRRLLPSLVADLHDSSSAVAELRRKGLDRIIDLTTESYALTGRPQPSRTTIDIFLNAVEYSCHRLFLDTDGGEEAVAAARALMLRIAIATLGGPHSWRRLLEDIELLDTVPRNR